MAEPSVLVTDRSATRVSVSVSLALFAPGPGSAVPAGGAWLDARHFRSPQVGFGSDNGGAYTLRITGATDIEVLSGMNDGEDIITGSYKVIRTLKNDTQIQVDNKAPVKTES